MKIGFIGSGKVATAFGIYLIKQGFTLSGYYSRTHASAESAASLTDSQAFYKMQELAESTDIIFITTNDDQIEAACNELASTSKLNSGQLVVHMSGALSSSILESAAQKGCCTYSMHPLQSFADVSAALEQLPNTFFCIEGNDEKLHILEAMLKKMKNQYFKLEPKDKVIYHAAACVFSNYLVKLMDEGLQLLESVGISKDNGFKAVLPLITGTIHNIAALGAEKALTGPIARGDSKTIGNHLQDIKAKTPESYDLYRFMAEKTLGLAKREKLKDMNKIKALELILFGGEA